MNDRPTFIDNRDGNTLARALNVVFGESPGEQVGERAGTPDSVRIATAFFTPTGFVQIAEALTRVPEVRLLLGADHSADEPTSRRALGEPAAAVERRRLGARLRRMDDGLRRERDRLPYTRTSATALRTLIAALRGGNIEVRRYERAFLHAKAYILTSAGDACGAPEGVIAGSSNLTAAGLSDNLELNLGRYDRPIVERARAWFDELWEQAEPYDLAEVFEVALRSWRPWEIFIRVLWQLYGDEVAEDAKVDGNLPLTSFQKHGVARALRLIRETGGCIVADEVGLGKTFVAGEVLQIYRERRQRAVLICPAALRDTTWKKFLSTYQLFVECLSFEQLASDRQLRDAQRPEARQQHLQRPLDEYQLVVVDEAHNYRNPDAPTRAAALRALMFGRRRDLLLLTATPVNNSLWDLYHLIRFFLRQDAHLADRGILSLRARFEEAMREDPSSLSPDVLYPVIDATTVKRTREFVRRHYANDTIKGPDGIARPIVFPQPKAISVRYDLDGSLPGFFDRLEAALDPDGADALVFARYTPDDYLRGGADEEEGARAQATVGLLRSGLLKRFESSAFAFRRTAEKMVREHDVFLDALDQGHVATTAFMQELSGDDDAIFETLATSPNLRDASAYDVDTLGAAVRRDRDTLRTLSEDAASITPDRDPKLTALVEALAEIAEQAAREATDAVDEVQKRKVLVFSFFADTVRWVRDFLAAELQGRADLAPYADRIVAVSGQDGLSDVSRHEAIQGFAPVSMEASDGQGADRYDLLISTDVLAEGVNLQQCGHIINFDMPWNPMRLVQRHGRIDRIGSPHKRVFLRTIFPADRLDQLLNLEQRILNKLAMAAASVGVVAPIEGSSHGKQVFTETRREIEKLLRENPSLYERGATAGAAQTGEEYRQTLRKALTGTGENIVGLPWKVGTGMVKGARRGVFFCAVVGHETDLERTYLRFVPAYDDWQPRVDDGSIVREIGTCLRLIECDEETEPWLSPALRDGVYDFWEVAQQDILDDWIRQTDPANLQPRVRPLNHRVAEFIRTNSPLDAPEDRMTRALDVLESPWPRREEIMLRGWFESNERGGTNLSRFLIDRILEAGLEPVDPAPPLPPISQDDVELVCWMGIEPEGAISTMSTT